MEIIQERLEREYNLDLITTAPSVVYKIHLTNGETGGDRQPHQLPPTQPLTASAEEPMVKASIFTPASISGIMELCQAAGVYSTPNTWTPTG